MKFYIIVPPLSTWDEPNKEKIWLETAISTAAKTPALAWRNHCRGDMSKVQAWFDRGYRLKEISVELVP